MVWLNIKQSAVIFCGSAWKTGKPRVERLNEQEALRRGHFRANTMRLDSGGTTQTLSRQLDGTRALRHPLANLDKLQKQPLMVSLTITGTALTLSPHSTHLFLSHWRTCTYTHAYVSSARLQLVYSILSLTHPF